MDYEKLRTRVTELRKIADALEAMIPYEEDIVIVDEDFLDRKPLPPPARIAAPALALRSKEEQTEAFVRDISDSLARVLHG